MIWIQDDSTALNDDTCDLQISEILLYEYCLIIGEVRGVLEGRTHQYINAMTKL